LPPCFQASASLYEGGPGPSKRFSGQFEGGDQLTCAGFEENGPLGGREPPAKINGSALVGKRAINGAGALIPLDANLGELHVHDQAHLAQAGRRDSESQVQKSEDKAEHQTWGLESQGVGRQGGARSGPLEHEAGSLQQRGLVDGLDGNREDSHLTEDEKIDPLDQRVEEAVVEAAAARSRLREAIEACADAEVRLATARSQQQVGGTSGSAAARPLVACARGVLQKQYFCSWCLTTGTRPGAASPF
jgi:hypothetical protein